MSDPFPVTPRYLDDPALAVRLQGRGTPDYGVLRRRPKLFAIGYGFRTFPGHRPLDLNQVTLWQSRPGEDGVPRAVFPRKTPETKGKYRKELLALFEAGAPEILVDAVRVVESILPATDAPRQIDILLARTGLFATDPAFRKTNAAAVTKARAVAAALPRALPRDLDAAARNRPAAIDIRRIAPGRESARAFDPERFGAQVLTLLPFLSAPGSSSHDRIARLAQIRADADAVIAARGRRAFQGLQLDPDWRIGPG